MKRRIVLDTNCLIQMIAPRSAYYPAWSAYRAGQYQLCVSNEILSEYSEIIERLTNANVANSIVSAIVHSPNTLMFNPQYRFRLIEKDPDDNKFVDCAVVAGADYIVSEDAHFNILKTIDFPKVYVFRLDEFMEDLKRK